MLLELRDLKNSGSFAVVMIQPFVIASEESRFIYRIARIYHESFNFTNFANFKAFAKIKATT